MSIRTILVAVSGGAASQGAVATACRLAQRFGAHLEGFHAKTDPREVVMAFADGFGTPIAGELLDRTVREVEEAAVRSKEIFEAAVTSFGLVRRSEPPAAGAPAAERAAASATWREVTGHAGLLVPQRGRLFDLIVLGRSDRVLDQPHTETLEETVVSTGRPLLVAPAAAPENLGETIAIAWNGSVEAVHAVSAAMPFLTRARAVRVLTAGNDEEADPAGLVELLRWHGVTAIARKVEPVEGVGVGELLLASAREEGADLLVMGGYGRSPWREMLFGGATRQIVGTSMLPLLLAH